MGPNSSQEDDGGRGSSKSPSELGWVRFKIFVKSFLTFLAFE